MRYLVSKGILGWCRAYPIKMLPVQPISSVQSLRGYSEWLLGPIFPKASMALDVLSRGSVIGCFASKWPGNDELSVKAC